MEIIEIAKGISDLWGYVQRDSNSIRIKDLSKKIDTYFEFVKLPENRTSENIDKIGNICNSIFSLEIQTEAYPESYFFFHLDDDGDEIENENDSEANSIYCDCYNVASNIYEWLETHYPLMYQTDTDNCNVDVNSIFEELTKNSHPQPAVVKQKPESSEKRIMFKNDEIILQLHTELKGYFPNKETELLKVLQGEQLKELLLFPHNQNKFVEVFRRLRYNGFILNTDTETTEWICSTFQFNKQGHLTPQPFKKSTVWDNLNKGKGEPPKKKRICIVDWLPYKSPLQLTRETNEEKL